MRNYCAIIVALGTALFFPFSSAGAGAVIESPAQVAQLLMENLLARDCMYYGYEALLDDDSPLISRRPHVDMNVIGIVPLQIATVTGISRSLQ